MIDTHAHIYLNEFDPDRQQILSRAREVGVEKIFLPNIDSSSIADLKSLADTEDMCYPMMGLHPGSVKGNWKQELQIIIQEIKDHADYYIAIGEIGLDLYWEQKYLEQQKAVFTDQILLAKELDLPIVIHCRDAFNEIFEVLESVKHDKLRGVFHCFTGSVQQAEHAIELGLKLGIGGIVTFKNAGLDKVVKELGLDHLVLETDAPYLAPAPFRGKRNESSYLKYIAQKVADILQVSVAEVERATNKNVQEVFKV